MQISAIYCIPPLLLFYDFFCQIFGNLDNYPYLCPRIINN